MRHCPTKLRQASCRWIVSFLLLGLGIIPQSISAQQSMVIAEEGLLLRAGPAQTYGYYALIPYGAIVTANGAGPSQTIDGRPGRWVRTSYGGYTGWVFSGYLEPVRGVEPRRRSKSSAEPDSEVGETVAVAFVTVLLVAGITLGVLLAGGFVFVFRNEILDFTTKMRTVGLYRAPEARTRTPDEPKPPPVSQPFDETSDFDESTKEALRKGWEFERHVASLFTKKQFTIVSWTKDHNKKTSGFYVEDNQNPDLIIRHNATQREFAVECKFRQKPWQNRKMGEDTIRWSSRHQVGRYQNFEKDRGLTVFVVIGIGGTPRKPKSMMCFPLKVAPHPELYSSIREKYNRLPSRPFAWQNGMLS